MAHKAWFLTPNLFSGIHRGMGRGEEWLANALNVEIYELFIVPFSPAMELKKLNEAIVASLEDIMKRSVYQAFEKERKRQNRYK